MARAQPLLREAREQVKTRRHRPSSRCQRRPNRRRTGQSRNVVSAEFIKPHQFPVGERNAGAEIQQREAGKKPYGASLQNPAETPRTFFPSGKQIWKKHDPFHGLSPFAQRYCEGAGSSIAR